MNKITFELSETLRHPSDVNSKLETIEKETKNKYEVHHKKFNSKLSESYMEIGKIKENYATLEEKVANFEKLKKSNINILDDFNCLIKDYKTVKTICIAHQRFIKIKNFMEGIKAVDEECLDDNLEVYHTQMYNKEEFQCEIEQYNVGVSVENLSKVEHAIVEIMRQSADFTLILLDIVQNLRQNVKVLDRINKIVQKEENRDMLTIQAKEGEKGNNPLLAEITKIYPRYLQRKPKNLKEKIIQVLKASIKRKFALEKEVFVNKLDFVLSDLNFLSEKVNFYFFTFNDFLEEYHTNLREAIAENLIDLDAGEILKLIEFKTDYYTTIESKYNKIAEGLGPRLIDNENELLGKYAETASLKLNTWIENITKKEIEKFNTRDSDLNKDEDDKLISSGFINLLQMIKVQLEPISFNKKVFLYITKMVRDYCEIFKDKICKEIEKDFIPTCMGKNKPGYEDYCIVFGNSGLKLTQYITSLPQCQSDEVRELGNIFIEILKQSNHYLAEFVMFTCKPALEKICTSTWNEGVGTLLVTLEDFLQDYQQAMSEFTFITFCHELCNSLVTKYYKRIASKKTKINDGMGENIRRDYKKILDMLDKYVNADDMKDSLCPMVKIVPIIESISDDIFVLELKSLLLVKKDLEQKLIETIIDKRSNLDSVQKKNYLTKVAQIFENNKN